MGLLSFNKRQDDSAGAAEAAPDAVTHARTRARRRLIGATVLLGIGVIGFPLVFETQPRPIPVDVPIEIPRRENAPPLTMPPAGSAASPGAVASPGPATTAGATAAPTATGAPPAARTGAAAAPAPAVPDPVPAAPAAAPAPMVTERAADQGREVPAAARPASATRPAASAPAVAAALPARPPSATPTGALAPRADDGRRAQALLEGKPPAAARPAEVAAKPADAAASRLVVQVGAYTDADKLREARQKVEKLGLKTYTQVVEADGSKRTRVRVGPFATRDEADKAAARIKAAGLPVAVLTL